MVNQVVPYVQKMPVQEIAEIAFDTKTREQVRLNTETLVVLQRAGRLGEYGGYRRAIMNAVNNRFEDWQQGLASELQGIAMSVVLSDLVGKTFVGDESAYDYEGVEIEVTEHMVDVVASSWKEHTTLV